MKNDILTRLRNTCCVVHGGIVHQIGGCTPCEAADEIERLRTELERWQLIAKTLGDGYSLTAEQRPALQAVYEQFYAYSPAVMEQI